MVRSEFGPEFRALLFDGPALTCQANGAFSEAVLGRLIKKDFVAVAPKPLVWSSVPIAAIPVFAGTST
jgi:hypothetical protein